MATQVIGTLCVEYFSGDPKRVKFLKPLRGYSETIKAWFEIPVGFICDLESVPIVKGTNNESGAIHDYFSRYNSVPVVSKTQCALIYLEFQRYFDLQEGGLINTVWDLVRRIIKTAVVWVAPRYFHRLPVNATYEQVVGIERPDVDVWYRRRPV
jgi:hypothetical protein